MNSTPAKRGKGTNRKKSDKAPAERITGSVAPRISSPEQHRISALDRHAREVLIAVAKGGRGAGLATQKRIAAMTGRSQPRISTLLRLLTERGFLEVIRGSYPKAYVPTEKGTTAAIALAGADEPIRDNVGYDDGANKSGVEREYRHHNHKGLVPIHRRPVDDKLVRAGWTYDRKMKWSRFTGTLLGVAVQLTPDNMYVHLPEIPAATVKEGDMKAFQMVQDVVEEFSRRFPEVVFGEPELLTGTSRVDVKWSQRHIALVGDPYAAKAAAGGQSIRTPLHEVDTSKGPGEFETVHPETAGLNMEAYSKFVDSYMEGDWDHALEAIKTLTVATVAQQQAREQLSRDMQDLTESVRTMADLQVRRELLRENDRLREIARGFARQLGLDPDAARGHLDEKLDEDKEKEKRKVPDPEFDYIQ